MTNINKILIVYIDLNSGGYMPSLYAFHYHIFFGGDKFIGITINNKSVNLDLEGCEPYKLFNPLTFEFSLVPKDIKNKVLNYIGYNMDLDGILDTMNSIESHDIRNHYLESTLYYKTNQQGKKINKFNLKVKHFDDLINDFSEDFYSYQLVKNNKDFSESEIILETFLTKNEVETKFKKYLLCDIKYSDI